MQEDAPEKTKDAAPTGTRHVARPPVWCKRWPVAPAISKRSPRLIGTTRSTTHRLASCLVDERYTRVVPQIGYLLGPKLIELGFQARRYRW